MAFRELPKQVIPYRVDDHLAAPVLHRLLQQTYVCIGEGIGEYVHLDVPVGIGCQCRQYHCGTLLHIKVIEISGYVNSPVFHNSQLFLNVY